MKGLVERDMIAMGKNRPFLIVMLALCVFYTISDMYIMGVLLIPMLFSTVCGAMVRNDLSAPVRRTLFAMPFSAGEYIADGGSGCRAAYGDRIAQCRCAQRKEPVMKGLVERDMIAMGKNRPFLIVMLALCVFYTVSDMYIMGVLLIPMLFSTVCGAMVRNDLSAPVRRTLFAMPFSAGEYIAEKYLIATVRCSRCRSAQESTSRKSISSQRSRLACSQWCCRRSARLCTGSRSRNRR